MSRFACVIALIVMASAASAQQPKAVAPSAVPMIAMDRYEGSHVATDLGYKTYSSLRRDWFVVRDDGAPAAIDGPTGIQVVHGTDERYPFLPFQYRMSYQLNTREPITAVEIRVHVIDVFGRLLKTLSVTELMDFSESRTFDASWRVWSEQEASDAFASIAYVARARTATGRVYEADRAAILEQVRRVARHIDPIDLEPMREPLPRQ